MFKTTIFSFKISSMSCAIFCKTSNIIVGNALLLIKVAQNKIDVTWRCSIVWWWWCCNAFNMYNKIVRDNSAETTRQHITLFVTIVSTSTWTTNSYYNAIMRYVVLIINWIFMIILSKKCTVYMQHATHLVILYPPWYSGFQSNILSILYDSAV